MMRLDESRRSPPLQSLVDGLLETGEVSVAVAGVLEGERSAWAGGGVLVPGQQSADAPIGAHTCFDLASLAKPLTATVALLLDEAGDLALDRPLGSLISNLPPAAQSLPTESLLRHRAGLIPWYPFYAQPQSKALAPEAFNDRRFWQQADESGVYSDLGPILWSLLVAEAGCSISSLLADRLGLEVSYAPSRRLTAATRLSNRREVELARALGIEIRENTRIRRGVPQDGNARWLREPGHAGLFGSLSAMLEFAGHWLRPGALSSEQIRRALDSGGRYALGWWRADPAREGLPAHAFGHNGFTGCSLWIEPERGRIMALLAHRTTLSDTLDPVRREFHRLALALKL